jgi:hypothetical protein
MLAVKYDTTFPPFNHKDQFTYDQAQADKDFFIEIAQEALEQVELEEEQKGVLYELIEALLDKTGAPMLTDVISQQLKSQDVIERLAEDHHDHPPVLCPKMLLSSRTLKEESSDQEEDILQEPHGNIAEYVWILFRLLLLASLVGLVNHFLYYHTMSSLTH